MTKAESYYQGVNADPGCIETSDDPVLVIRPAAYAVSFSRRMEP